MKIYNFKNFIFKFSNFFWYDCFFSLGKLVGKNRFYSPNDIFCTFVFNLFWWMTLDCFACISVIFGAINFVRYTYESLDFEDSKNMWFFPKNVDLGWETAKTKKGVKNSVLACSHRKTKKYRSEWKFTI